MTTSTDYRLDACHNEECEDCAMRQSSMIVMCTQRCLRVLALSALALVACKAPMPSTRTPTVGLFGAREKDVIKTANLAYQLTFEPNNAPDPEACDGIQKVVEATMQFAGIEISQGAYPLLKILAGYQIAQNQIKVRLKFSVVNPEGPAGALLYEDEAGGEGDEFETQENATRIAARESAARAATVEAIEDGALAKSLVEFCERHVRPPPPTDSSDGFEVLLTVEAADKNSLQSTKNEAFAALDADAAFGRVLYMNGVEEVQRLLRGRAALLRGDDPTGLLGEVAGPECGPLWLVVRFSADKELLTLEARDCMYIKDEFLNARERPLVWSGSAVVKGEIGSTVTGLVSEMKRAERYKRYIKTVAHAWGEYAVTRDSSKDLKDALEISP